ncbi:P-loop containing nucleoside triphosphate hydrolase protein [Aspergillus uvarum CBS 121591]|uniref:P-loop containing nucleoside triphosphate hydrolase protein n=1 Tax=Aspergillus uvarum CBS 121591 TaxID=1448315 RepID=A0A319CKX8_9EURO|nr:P-loop containing nucleoside triphosphate hydrolase protein [Aspergillus uvarum CBS 121591]PYH84571.1 P-loop containing nucleoside triphosphate hydrolase protein [Aspergillus uvarum CBS 121591]
MGLRRLSCEKADSCDQLPIYRYDGRALGVALENVTAQGPSGGQRTVPDLPQLLRDILRSPWHLLRSTFTRQTPARRNIVQGVSGVLFPGETMLVLGRPGAGCTTVLKIIANTRESFDAVQGEVHYGALRAEQMTNELKSEVVYSSEDDIHFPTLTVADTLDFALKLRKPATHPGRNAPFSAEYTQRLVNALGIGHAKNTIVGDAFIRGVSGGERRRVSLAEAMTINSTLVSWDNPIRGLDSSSALEFLRLLKRMSRATGMTNIATLYQVSENMYQECFYRTLVMYDGRMIFCGKLGFYCPERQTTPDFLTSVTSPVDRTIRADYAGPLYLDPDSLAEAFKRSTHYAQLQKELLQYPLRNDVGNPSTIWKQIAVGTERTYRLLWGDWKTLLTVVVLCAVNAVITGSGFYAAPRTASGSFERSGALFFAAAYFCLNALTEVGKTHNMGLLHPAAYAVIQTVADIPSALIQTTVETASQFFIFLLIVFAHYSAIATMFRMLGAWAPGLNIAHLLAGCALPVACLYSGYAPPVPTMHRWGSWIRRVTPTPYAVEAMIGNEFWHMQLHCTESQLIPQGPGYDDIRYQACPMAGAQEGSASVDAAVYAENMYGYTRAHLWRNFGIILVFWFLYMVLGAVGLTFMTRDSGNATGPVFKRGAVIPQRVENSMASNGARDDSAAEKGSVSGQSETDVDEVGASPRPGQTQPSVNRASFTFEDLCYTVTVGGGEKQLLDHISGYVKPGQLTALMGASGAGKTTLLDNLAQRKSEGRTTGDIRLGGEPPHPLSFARSCGFCMQQDVHDPTTTVREALQFSALLRRPAEVPREEKLAYVEQVISLLELERIADALVGSTGDGQLSVEERKRVTIGVELVAKPSALLFLDEPTSGLDSQAAYSIVAFLQKIALHEGVPIVCTIHQPSGVLFEMFDHIMLLAPGGRTVYFGETGARASTVASYFARYGAVMGPADNPAEFIISTVAGDKVKQDWPLIWNESPERQALREKIRAINAAPFTPANADRPGGEAGGRYAMPLGQQVLILTQRHWKAVWRNGQYNFSRLVKSIFFELFVSFTFFHVTPSTSGLQNHMLGILLSIWIVPSVAADVQAVWYEKWAIFEARERNGVYDCKALLAALILVEIPWFLGLFTLIFLMTYWTFGFASTASIAGVVYGMYLLFALFGLGVIYLMAAFFPNATMAGYAMSLFWVLLLMFSGAANPYTALNDFYRPWLWWADPLTYFFEATVSTVLHDVQVQCTSGDLAVFDIPNGTCREYLGPYLENNPGYLLNPSATQACEFCPYSVGDEYARSLHFYFDDRARDAGVFLAFCVTNFVLLFGVTWFTRVQMRRWRK